MNRLIASALHRWLLNRKPYSVALVGMHSGELSPPLDFLRFKTYEEAERWVLEMDLSSDMTQYVIVDLRALAVT